MKGDKQILQVSPEHPIIQRKIEKAKKLSIWEGSHATASFSLGRSYMTPFLLALNSTSFQIGLLNSLINFLPSLIQIKTSKLIEKYSRKRIVIWGLIFESLFLIPLIFLAFAAYHGTQNLVWPIIILITLHYTISAPTHPAWFSWMGSLITESERGKYFAKRNKITGFIGLIFMIAGALFLEYYKSLGLTLIAFGILFTFATILRIISLIFLVKQYEPKIKITNKDYFSFRDYLKKIRETPFGRFSIYSFFSRVAIGIASPFFAVLMLRELQLSYIWFMAITVSAVVFQLLFYSILGKASDRFGNIKVLRFSSFFIALTPILWLVSKNPVYLLIVPSIASGLGWAGLNLSSTNYIYDTVSQKKTSFGVTYYSLLIGLGMALGSGIGSLLTFVNLPLIGNLYFIFLISTILRFGTIIFLGPTLREVRHVKKFTAQFIFKEIRPMQGIVKEIQSFGHPKSKIIHHI